MNTITYGKAPIVKVTKGAYFASLLLDAQKQGRIGRVTADPLADSLLLGHQRNRAKADATAIWAVQFVGHEIRVLNYYEPQRSADGRKRPLAEKSKATSELCKTPPHDGGQQKN